MFDGVNLKNCLPSKTIFIGNPIKSNEHNYSIGRPEWQQNWTTTTKTNYTEKDVYIYIYISLHYFLMNSLEIIAFI